MQKKNIIFILIIGFIISIITSYVSQINMFSQAGPEKTYAQIIDSQDLLTKAKQSYYAGNLQESKDLYQELVRREPDNYDALHNLIIISKELRDVKGVIDYFQQLTAANPDNLMFIYEYGITLYQTGKYDQAGQLLNRVYSRLEENENQSAKLFTLRKQAMLSYYLGKSLQQIGQLEKALSFFQRGISLYPSLTLNYLGQAEIFALQNKVAEAITSYKKALAKDNSLSVLYPEIAGLYGIIGQPKNAYYYWKRSLGTGNQVVSARERISTLESKYPELLENEKKKIEEQRETIRWVKVKPIENSENIPLIRLGIRDNASALSFQTGADFNIIDVQQGEILFSGEARTEWKIKYKKGSYYFYRDELLVKKYKLNSPVSIQLTDPTATTVLYDISYGQGYFWAGNEDRQYRGGMELYPVTADKFNVINIVNMEEYLLSVVPAEMPSWWPPEALKAQTIAARSYAFRHMGKYKEKGYDLCTTVQCAVYKGVTSENRRTTSAVLATRGEIGSYQGRVIDAVFSSNSGGYTENSKDVWGIEVPYLTGVSHMIEEKLSFPLEPNQLKDWLIQEPPSYSNNRNYTGLNSYRWIKVLSADYLVNKYKLERLVNVLPLGRSEGGSVEEILIKGEKKEITIRRDRIRSGLGGLRSNRFVIERVYDSQHNLNQLIIYGSGWGHNVGMDQTGSAGMAEKGFTYDEIIGHFYPGAVVEKKY